MRTGKLWELAAMPDMPSEPTLRAFIRSQPDFPVVTSGRKGVEYVFDLDAASAFVRVNWQDRRSELSGVARASRAARKPRQSSAQPELPYLFADTAPEAGA